MQKREFNAILRSLSTKRRGQPPRLDIAKAVALTADAKARMVEHLVSNRGPVLKALLGPGTDMGWLHACGYMYPYSNAGFDFIGQCDHKVGAEMQQRANAARLVAGTVAPSVMAG